MKIRSWMLVLVAVVGVGLASPAARADGQGDKKEAKEEKKEEKKERKDAREDVKEAKKDLREALKDGGPDAQAVKEARGDLKEARKKLKDTRDERRAAEKSALKAKYGDDLVKKPAVRAELRLHALRMAKLHHMKRLADAGEKKAIEERVDKLIAREKARHEARMEALKAKNGEDK